MVAKMLGKVLVGLLAVVAGSSTRGVAGAGTGGGSLKERLVTKVEIEELPGWEGKKLPSRWFSGYLSGGKKDDGKDLYYHYVLIESEGNPKTDPLILWTNGGPGASSVFGLMTEVGPLQLNRDSLKTEAFNKTGIPSLFRSEFGWSKLGSMLILNGPAPVSYSICDPPGPAADGKACGNWNDTSTAKANYQFLESFFQAYPEYTSNDFYLTGESYAGIYIPTLAREILSHDISSSFSRRVFKGMAIGDGCVGKNIVCAEAGGPSELGRIESIFQAQFLHGHHQFSTPLFKKIVKACGSPNDLDFENDDNYDPAECSKLMHEMTVQVGKNAYFEYGLYDECYWDDPLLPNHKSQSNAAVGTKREELDLTQSASIRRSRILGGANDYPCGGGTAHDKWISHPKVKAAMGVPAETKFVSGDNSAALDYTMTETDLRKFHRKVALDSNLRVVIYNGDTDPSLNSFLGEWWVNTLNLGEKESWRPWTLDGKRKVAGYSTVYQGNFEYVTIRGSGHMTPNNKPAASFVLLQNFLSKKPMPPFDP